MNPLFLRLLEAAGITAPVEEYRFHPTRRWRLDLAWPEKKTALEIEGGLYGRGKKCPLCGRRRVGAHTSIKDLLDDLEKYNTAAILGWRIVRCTPTQFASGEAVELVRKALEQTK